MNKISHILYQPYKWLIVLPVFIVITVICALITIITACISITIARPWGIIWAKVMQWVTPMHVKVIGRENIKPGQSYVIAANHQSAYDIFVIYGSLGIDFKWIMKHELRNIPLMGYACYKLNHIFINRTSKMAAYRSIQRAKDILVGGTSVVIFPEGTRSGSNKMAPLKHGAFKMAFDLELPILPVSINGTYRIMGNGLSSLKPGSVDLIIHKPIDIKDFTEKRDELISLTAEAIASGLNK